MIRKKIITYYKKGMSWYNDDLNNGFIDTTQDFVGGGGSSTTITNIQEDLTDLKEVFIPKQINPLTSIVETYIKNTYINSKIYIVNNNTDPKVKIEEGHLYVYYDYNPAISLLDLSQYVKVSDYIIGVNVGVRNLNIAISALSQVVNTHTTDILAITTSLTTQAQAITVIGNDLVILDDIVISHGVRITTLEGGDVYYHALKPETYERVIQDLAQLRAGIRLRAFSKENLSQLGFFIRNAIPVALAFLGLTGVVAVAVSGIQYIRDIILSDQENKNLKILKEVYDIKNEDADFNVKNKLFHTGLSVSPTNNNGMTDGKYSINLRNGDVVIDFIVVGGVASVEWVDKTDEPNSVGDFFNIDKSLLGGSVGSGSIRLDVTAVFSIKEIIEYMMNQSYLKAEDIKGRQRRRDKILNEDTIGNNFIIEYTPYTESTGEISQIPTIKLNLNSAQLETINGVLNIKKYVNTDTTDAISSSLSNVSGNVFNLNSILNDVLKVILPIGQTITSDYKLNLGYKEIFTGFPYDLIMLAIKKETYTTFSSVNYNYDYLGYFPNMNRLSQYGDIKVVSDSTLTVNASQHMTKGYIYLKNTNELKTFNLNRKFEFVSFLKFVSFNNNVTDYHLIQTGVDLGQGFIELDYTKFSLYIRNRRFKIKHPAVVEYQIYTVSNNNAITAQLITPNTYVILEPYTISSTVYNDNIRIGEQYIAGNPNDFQYDLRMINVPYKINNNTPYINTPTGLIKTVNLNDTSTPTNDSRYIQMYLNHPSNPNTTYANCIFPTIQYSIGMTQAGVVASTPTWHIQKIVLVFDILFHIMIDTNPPGFVENPPPYIPFPSIQQYEKAETNSTIDFTFRLRYSFDGITYTTHNFTMNDVVGEPVYDTPFNYIDTGFYGNDIRIKQRWTYSFDIPTTYPIYGNKVRFVDFTLVRKPNFPYHSSYASGTATTAYHNQAMLHLYEFKLVEYQTSLNPTMIQTTAINYETTDENTPLIGLSSTPWYLFNLQMDLQNDYISYFINDIFYEITTRAPIKLYPSDIVMPDSTIPFITASFVRWGNLTLDNSLLVIGNLPSTGSINFTHFNWRYFQSNETFLTLVQYQKLKELINYIYYYDYVSVDKLLDTNEISANNIITRQLIINNNPIISSLTSTTRSRDLRTNQTQEVANVLIPLTNLYVINPIKSGTIFYNFLTKSFTIGTGTRSEEEDDAILELIGTTAGFGLQWDATTNTLSVIPEDLYQDLTPVYTQIETTSNILLADYIARDAVLDTKINTTSNILLADYIARDDLLTTDYIARDVILDTKINTTSNILLADYIARDDLLTTDYIARDVILDTKINTTSNYLLADYIARDDVLTADYIARDVILDTKINTTSNILLADYIARDGVLTADYIARDVILDTKINTTSNILLADYIARDDVLNTAITNNAYSDTKVSTYLGNTATKTIGGTLQVATSTGGGIIKLGGTADDAGFDLATIENREYSAFKSEIVIFKGNDIEGVSGADRIRLRAGAIAFDTYSTTSTSAITQSIRMYITGTGLVGIGTTIPDDLLTIRTTTSTARLRLVSSSTTGNAYIRFMKSDGNSLGYDIGYEGATTNNLQFIAYNNTTTGRIDMQIARSTGNVGIGTVPSATFKLNVNGGINASSLSINNNAIIQSQWTTSGTMIYYNTGNVTIGTTTNSSDDGNINITTPDSTLYVRGAATAGSQTNITFRGGLEGNSNGKVRIWLLNDAAHSSYIQSEHTGNGNTHLTFGTANGNFLPTEKMKISNDGRVDINNRLVMTGTDPTIIFKDTDQRSGFIHMNSSVMYFLNGSGNGSETWAQQNGQNWALQLNMDNNRATFGGIVVTPAIYTSTFYDFSGTYAKMVLGSGYTEFYGTSATSTNNFIYAGNGFAYFSSASTYFADLVCKFNGSTWTTSWIGASSSAKIKQDIEDLDDAECLNKLLQLRPVKYRYIDITKNFDATKKVYGFIAEEVKSVFSEAVSDKNSELIPNIYLMASAEGDILTIAKELELNIEYTCYLSDKTEKIIALEDLGDGDYKINKTFQIKTDIFVYGKIDNNFHILKKEYFHAVTISAVQELHRTITRQQNEITDLKERLAKLEGIVSGMLSGST